MKTTRRSSLRTSEIVKAVRKGSKRGDLTCRRNTARLGVATVAPRKGPQGQYAHWLSGLFKRTHSCTAGYMAKQ